MAAPRYHCPVCDSANVRPYHPRVKSVYSRKAYDVMHCADCDHFFTEPKFTTKELDKIYATRYSYDAHALIANEKQMRASKYADYIAGIPGVKSVMEVGCMHGLLLTELQKRGIKVAGVELDPEAVKYCRERGLDVTQSSIENHLKTADKKYDAIVMSHVIEHIVKPKSQLLALNKRMHPKGRLILITPNSHSFTRRLFGRFWGYWQVPVHINHFNQLSMRHLLERTGYDVTDQKFYGGDSLFFLSTFANMLGSSNDGKNLSPAKKAVVKVATVLLKPWYFVGHEDMVVIAKPKAK